MAKSKLSYGVFFDTVVIFFPNQSLIFLYIWGKASKVVEMINSGLSMNDSFRKFNKALKTKQSTKNIV